MRFNIDFTQLPRLEINGKECTFNQEVSGNIPQTNKSVIMFKDVHWKDFTDKERYEKPFIVPTYASAKFYFGNELFFYGIAIATINGSLSPFIRKHASVKIISIDTFLSEGKFMDFVISNEEPEISLDRIINKLGINKIIKGSIHFEDNIHIKNYNLQDKTAYAGLNEIAKQTNSTMIFGLDQNENITINYYSKNYLEKNSVGANINYTNDATTLNFWNLYRIVDMKQKEINVRTSNLSRMYSDNTISTILDTKEINLSTIQGSENTRFPIGRIENIELFNGKTLVRKLIFITENQSQNNQLGDVVYSIKSNKLSFKNSFGLLNLNTGIIKVKYFPIIGFSYQSENKDHQEMIFGNNGLEGVLSRVEKRNDLTDATDIIAQNKHTLTKYSGIHKAITIKSGNPIWEIGNSTKFISKNVSYVELVGIYKIKSIKFDFTITNKGIMKNSMFTYEIIKSFDFESGINFYDTKQYKQNHSFGQQDIFELKTFETTDFVVNVMSRAVCKNLDSLSNATLEHSLEKTLKGWDTQMKVLEIS